MSSRANSSVASARGSRAGREESSASNIERKIMGVPASIMRPRLVFVAVVFALTCFGLVMIFSASSIEALSEQGDAAYYLKRQLLCIGLGLMLAFCTGFFDYHSICSRPVLLFLWVVTMGMLVVVFVAGSGANGATRWLSVGPLRIQPSEFAKVTVLYTAAMLASEFFGGRAMSYGSFAITVGVALGGPLALILVQPDKGTTGIIVLMIVSLAYASGFRRDLIVKVLGALCAIAMVIVLSDDYSRQRVLTMLDPWLDQWDSGYQLTQGFMAFGSGGLFGRGLGMSVAKYSYLPEAHNDFIFAVIGEELGLVGTLSVIALFVLLAYEAKKIADSAPDLMGHLIVIGATTLFLTQFFLNVFGVLGFFPLSGKPLPFLSYGGSSIMSCLALAGAIVGVSRHSSLPETEHDRRRRQIGVVSDEEDTGVGEAHVRGVGYATPPAGRPSSRGSVYPGAGSRAASTPLQGRPSSGGAFTVVEGGAGRAAGPRQRINLQGDARSRLRSDDAGPRVRNNGGASGGSNRPRRRG